MAVKLLDKDEWTKDGRKWIFYDYVKNLDGKEIPVDQNGKHAIYVGKLLEESISQRSFSLKQRH